eukprot:5744600-Alexandrium_andersonii.AAC.1
MPLTQIHDRAFMRALRVSGRSRSLAIHLGRAPTIHHSIARSSSSQPARALSVSSARARLRRISGRRARAHAGTTMQQLHRIADRD